MNLAWRNHLPTWQRTVEAACWLLILSLAFVATGCATIKGRLPAPVPPQVTGAFQAGAARVDITPVPGFPMGGHSVGGQVARGVWNRLAARAIFLEDPQGHPLVLVACDLWSLPAGLADRIAQLVAADPSGAHIGRDQIILAATHTHQSPGNFSSCALYNEFASPKGGFDRALFEFLATRIAGVILDAARTKEPAEVFFGETTVAGLARNRSFPAFVRDPECDAILNANAALPLGSRLPDYPDLDAYRAVDPHLSVLRVVRAGGGQLLAVAAFVAVHNTAMSHETKFYTSDLFGVAARLTEEKLSAPTSVNRSGQPIVALFNGAEGDISPAWETQDRANALRLGGLLSARILDLCSGGWRADGPIAQRFTNSAPLAHIYVTNSDGTRPRTAGYPLGGAPQLGGAEDGRTQYFYGGYVEGMAGDDKGEHGVKLAAVDLRYLGFHLPVPITRLAMAPSSVPAVVPVGVYQIGAVTNVVIVTLPGEFTTVMGRRIATGVSNSLPVPPARVLLAGLANEYVSYFVTPEEYDAQHYEGASTLYGRQAGPAVGQHLAGLAAKFARPAAPEPGRSFRYSAGLKAHFGVRTLASDTPASLAEALAALVKSQTSERFEWQDAMPELGRNAAKPVWPHVRIERQTADGAWHPVLLDGVEESSEGLDFVTMIVRVGHTAVQWRAVWLPPPGRVESAAIYRFEVQTAAGRMLWSKPFRLPP